MNTYKKIITEICEELGIKYNFISKDWITILEYNNERKVITGYKFDNNSHALGILLDDKYATYEYLKLLNINAVSHEIIYNPTTKGNYAKDFKGKDYLKNIFNSYNKNVVLKINNGTCGKDVYHIKSYKKLEETYQKLSESHHSLSICPYYEVQNEYRVIVLNGKIKLIYKKIKPQVIGDGIHTIKELLIDFNPTYFKNYNKSNKNKILPPSKEYTYDWKFNLSRGSKLSFVIDEETKKQVTSLATKALKTSLQFGSIDIIKTKDNEYLVLEINSGVMMHNLIKEESNGYEIAKEIYKEAIKDLFHLK